MIVYITAFDSTHLRPHPVGLQLKLALLVELEHAARSDGRLHPHPGVKEARL